MASLSGVSVASSYTSLLKLSGNTDTLVDGDGSNAIQVVDGDGTISPLYLNKDRLGIGGQPSYQLDINLGSGVAQARINTGANAKTSLIFKNSVQEWEIGNSVGDNNKFTIRDITDSRNAFVIDGSGNAIFSDSVGIGVSTMESTGGGVSRLQVEGTTHETSSVSITRNSNSANAGYLTFSKSRGTSVNSDTIVQDDDAIGSILFAPADGTDRNSISASIQGAIDGTPGSNDVPGRLVFSTTADGANSVTERMIIDSEGTADHKGNYIVNEQGRQDFTANSISSPYYRFDGTDDLINIGDEANLEFNTNMSISVWVKFSSATITGVNGIFGKWLDSADKEYFLAVLDDEKLYFYTSSSGSNATAVATDVLTGLDKWNNFTVTYNAGAVTIYRNGVSIKTGTGESSLHRTGSANAYIGAYQAGANFFNGEMSKVQLFNNTLTATEVKELYSGASVPYKYKGANQTNLTSGTLVKGKAYRITTYNSNDDFTNLGASSNATGVEFVSTGTTPTEWLHSSVLHPIGAVAEYDGSSAGSKVWGDKSGNGLHGTVGAGTLDATAPTLENTPYDAGTEYEEGLFSPTLITSGNGFTSVTYDGANGGKYVRVGNLVHVQGFLSTDAITVGSASGNIAIGGLPYALSSVSSGLQDGHASFTIGVSKSWAGENPTRAVADANTSQFGLYYQEHNADYGIVEVADVGTGTNHNIIYFSGTYKA